MTSPRSARGKAIALTVSDQKSGIRNVSVTISQEGRDQVVLSENYARGTREQTLSPELNLRGLNLKDGPATITITAEDHSWLKNRTTLAVDTSIDTVPPQIGMISSAHNVNAGGTGVALYRVSEEVTRTGIRVGDRFFQGYPYAIQGKPCHIAYFAIPASAVQRGTQDPDYRAGQGGKRIVRGSSPSREGKEVQGGQDQPQPRLPGTENAGVQAA